jgi:hypothetical protein
VLVPALSVLLYWAEMEGIDGNWLPAVQQNEAELVRLRLPIFLTRESRIHQHPLHLTTHIRSAC